MVVEWSDASVALLAEAAPAVLTTYRRDGSASTSPVWFRYHEGSVEVVLADGDPKLRHLQRDPRCLLSVFDTRPPFRGVKIEGVAHLERDEGSVARLEIATRYLGLDGGREFVELRGKAGFVLQVTDAAIHQWDLSPILPESVMDRPL